MHTGTVLFGGLPYILDFISPAQLCAYLLILLLGDGAGGVPAARLILRSKTFVLVRAGWKRWFRGVLLRCLLSAAVFCAALLLVGLCEEPTWKTVLAWLLYAEHILMLAALQALLIALFQNAFAGEVTVIFLQLVSLFFSWRLMDALAILMPGNWGMLARTAEFVPPQLNGERHGGFPLWTAFALNAAVLLLIVFFGWRLVRHRNLKE